ncbi:MAG: LytR/AlgR family response regulator transcription factor [Flavobacteriales bacterium]
MSEILKAVIVDDEEPARENLAMLLEEYCPGVQIVGKAERIEQAKKIIAETSPDVVFLDIRMPSGTEGFELLDELNDRNFMVVFVTAFKDYAIRAFNANAVHYVLKPIDIDDLQLAVDKVREQHGQLKQQPDLYVEYVDTLKSISQSLSHNTYSPRITIHHTKGIKIIDDHDILYLEADGNCTQLFFTDGTRYMDTRTLSVYENLLNPQKFYRIHKSYIVNLQYVKEYINDNGYFVLLKNNVKVPVSRSRNADFVGRLKTL